MWVVQPVFLYDFNSPYAYLAAARVDEVLGPDVRWQPIAFAFLLRAQGREPWSFHDPERAAGIATCERRAAERGLPPMVWPPGWPQGSYTLAPLRAALVAAGHGMLREYSRAAFARNFVAGTGLADDAAVDVAAELGLDPEETRSAMAGPAKAELAAATDAAIAAGVVGVPTVMVGEKLFWGDDRLGHAAAAAGRP